MSQQMQLMYPETPCFGENKRTQKITQNTRKYILRHATKVTISEFAADAAKKKRASCGFFWREPRKKMMRTFNYCLKGTLIFSMIFVSRAAQC